MEYIDQLDFLPIHILLADRYYKHLIIIKKDYNLF